jgi:hypothetical protein
MRRFVLRKPGYRIPDAMQKKIARFYPSVRVAWNLHFKRWIIINRVAGGWEPIGLLQKEDGGYVHPHERKILNYLHKASTVNLRNKWGFEAWLQGFDSIDEYDQALRERRASEQIREGSKDIWDKLHNKLLLPQFKMPKKKHYRPNRNGAVILGRKNGKVQWSHP